MNECPASSSWQDFFFKGGCGRAGVAEVDLERPVPDDSLVGTLGICARRGSPRPVRPGGAPRRSNMGREQPLVGQRLEPAFA